MPSKGESKSVKSPAKESSAKTNAVTMKTKRTKKTKDVEATEQVSEQVSEQASEQASEPVVEKKTTKSKKATKSVEEVTEPAKSVKKVTKPVKKAASKKEESVDEVVVETKSKKVKKEKDPNAPKKELNPIMKEMNRFRNEVIGPVVGSKAPKVTIPPFKLALADARGEMKMDEKDKNTVEVVQLAVSLFEKNTSKYVEN